MISLHNSYSEYGIYHSWRQYQEMKTNVTIYFRYRTGRNANYDPNSSGSSEYNYSNIPYTANNGPIIGIYNGDTLIYCSAYYQGTTLTNTLGTYVSMKLPAGTYTIRVMRLGKGLVLGESGESMTFTVDRFDRTIDPYTGEYNKYNNYGYISEPSKQVYFDFDYEGLSFDVKIQTIDLGTNLLNVDGVEVWDYIYPSYEEVKAEVEKVHLQYVPDDTDWTYTLAQYVEDGDFNAYGAGGLPVPYDMCIHNAQIQTSKIMLNIYNNVGLDQSSPRGTMDVTDMVGVTTPVGYYKCYQREGVDYDPMTADPKHLTSDAYVLSLQSYVTLDAKRMRYIHPTSEEQIKTANYRVLGWGNAGLSNFSTGVNGTTYPLSVVRGDQNYSYDVTRIVKTNTRADVYFNYDPVTATSDKHLIEYVPVLSVQYSESYYYFRYKPSDSNSVYDEQSWRGGGNIPWHPDPYTPENCVTVRINDVVDRLFPPAQEALNDALLHWDKTVDDGFEHWFEKNTQTTNLGFVIPLDLIFNQSMQNAGDFPVYYYDHSKIVNSQFTVTPVVDSYGDLRRIDVEMDYPPRNKDYETLKSLALHRSVPTAPDFDLSDYEFAADMTTGWVNTNNGPLVLRQTVIDIDLSDVPDHQITPN